jgi:hypothetical protein
MARDELLAVFDSDADAREAVRTLQSVGIDVSQVRIDDARDRVSAARGDMRAEIDKTLAPKEMVEGSLIVMVLGALVGAVVALPFAAIPFGDMAVGWRILIVMLVGLAVGGTVGWVIGGGFGAKQSDEPLAGETGATVALPATPAARNALIATHARRIDLISASGNPVSTVKDEREGLNDIARNIGRHMGSEDRRG